MWRLLLLINLFALSAYAATESADDYFNYGAQDYIFGDKKKATSDIVTGLQLYPKDPKLNGVFRLLQRPEQKPPPQSKNSKSDNKNQDQKDQQGKQNQKNGQSQQSDQQKKDQEKAKQDQAKKDEEKKKQQQAQASPSDQHDKDGDKDQQAAMAQAMMSPEEARQLLDSQAENEKVLIFAPSNQPASTLSARTKDW